MCRCAYACAVWAYCLTLRVVVVQYLILHTVRTVFDHKLCKMTKEQVRLLFVTSLCGTDGV